MSELTTIELKCSICSFYGRKDCLQPKCVRCVVNKEPGSGCVGINDCRLSTTRSLSLCKKFSSNEWDL